MNKDILLRYINDKCTDKEIGEVLKWLQDEADTYEGKLLLRQIWNYFPQLQTVPSMSYELMLNKLHHDINLSRSTQTGKTGNNKRSRLISSLTRIAAILFIPLLVTLTFTLKKLESVSSGSFEPVPVYTEITSPMGSQIFMELPDGSKVWLNHGSSMRFPQKFSGNSRTVELSGEGYFQVAHNEHKPFIVKTGDLQVLGIGTEFNIMAYPDNNVIETTLKSGKVLIRKEAEDGTIHPVLEMKPNYHTNYFIREGKFVTTDKNIDKYISWKQGKLIFRDDSIETIIKRLSKWYNVDIQLKDKELLKYTYTATFVDESLTQVLDLLKIATPIDYTISSRIKQDDESFSKRKIIISYKEK